MDVKFIKTKKANLGTVPVVDGQIIAVDDACGVYYDMNSTRRPVGSIKVSNQLTTIGSEDELLAVTSGSKPGVYYWDSANKCYTLLANKDTDTFMSFVQDASKTKIYITGTDGTKGSMSLFYNDNLHMDLSNGTITAVQFIGKATEAAKADRAVEADHAAKADVAAKATAIDVPDAGDESRGVYFVDGKPVSCSYTVKSNVPENAKFTDTTYNDFKGATANSNGANGLVIAPKSTDYEKFLKGDGTWATFSVPAMKGCTASQSGTSGSVPAPGPGNQNKFLKGDGTWQDYTAGAGLSLNSFQFSLKTSGVTKGVYGPVATESDGVTYIGDYIPVPQITVDEYGRITSIKEIQCKLNIVTPDPEPQATLMQFNLTSDKNNLLCTYDDMDTALAEFELTDDGILTAEYQFDPTPYNLTLESDDHVYATEVEE